MHHRIKSPHQRRGLLSTVCDSHQAASLQPICLSPHHLLRRLCHFLGLDERWAKDACHEFGLSYLLSERNHFRHFLEELVSREATLLFWPSYAFNFVRILRHRKRPANAAPPCGAFWAQTRHFLALSPALAMAGVANEAALIVCRWL